MVRTGTTLRRRLRNRLIVEVVIDSAESAVAAEEGGAARVELCANVPDGGTTPSAGMIERVRRICSLPIFVMIRPRGGDFCYTPGEFEVMKRDIRIAQESGAEGVVLGLLERTGRIDAKRTAQLVKLAAPLGVTFHRAFDVAPDPLRSLEEVIETGAERILTSGHSVTAWEGRKEIRDLVDNAGGRIAILAGGGVNHKNVAGILAATRVGEIHVGNAVAIPVAALSRRDLPFAAGNPRVVSAEKLRHFIVETELPAT